MKNVLSDEAQNVPGSPPPEPAKLLAHPMSAWSHCKCHLRNGTAAIEYRSSCAKVTLLGE